MDKKPLMIDLYCGLGGWASGGVAEGYYTVGFDIERHDYGTGGYPGQLVLQDAMTIHGRQFRDAQLIVASPPCQEYSYMAMPWSRAKAIAADYRAGVRDVKQLTALFDACFRIQREACEASGRHIPMIVENVRGAIPWVGRSRWNYGSFHLWGDVPALMPMTRRAGKSPPGNSVGAPLWKDRPINSLSHSTLTDHAREWYGLPNDGMKTVGHINKRDGHGHTRHLTNQGESDGIKQGGIGGTRANSKGDARFQDGMAQAGSKSKSRKAASAAIAKIPLPLAQYIAAHFKN
jgi:hypothetical protein